MHYFNQLINTQYKEEFENMPMTLMARALLSLPFPQGVNANSPS